MISWGELEAFQDHLLLLFLLPLLIPSPLSSFSSSEETGEEQRNTRGTCSSERGRSGEVKAIGSQSDTLPASTLNAT